MPAGGAFPSLWESDPVLPVQRAVLDGLGDVGGGDMLRAREIGDGARDLEDAVVGPRGKIQIGDRSLERFLRVGIQRAVFVNFFGAHSRVAMDARIALEPFLLDTAGVDHPLADCGGVFAACGGG